jgi:hypothetical protein
MAFLARGHAFRRLVQHLFQSAYFTSAQTMRFWPLQVQIQPFTVTSRPFKSALVALATVCGITFTLTPPPA